MVHHPPSGGLGFPLQGPASKHLNFHHANIFPHPSAVEGSCSLQPCPLHLLDCPWLGDKRWGPGQAFSTDDTLHTEYLQLKKFEKTGEAGSSLYLLPQSFFPEAGHKTFMWEVPSLHLEKRSILIFQGKGIQRKIPANKSKFPQVTALTSYS